ncbi:MAG: hypothetical protein HQM08_09825 [Candidatus Riflebacteria bacterium]|nr:hypothetical protein [Candidatus Riflebacteria bacterium]
MTIQRIINGDTMSNFFSRWFMFLKERFEPVGTTLTIAAFFGANAFAASEKSFLLASGPLRLLGSFALVWLVFLHMRLFDEVKDYAFDTQHNPHRPLARGLISLDEFGFMTFMVILSEITIAALLGRATFTVYAMLLAFTLLMRMEFFIGDWLRPKLESYAISHTFSASLLGLTTGVAVCGVYPFDLNKFFYFFALSNWFIFNVFEFGRKTFGSEEERDGVDSYSIRLYPIGAFLLLFVNLAIGIALCFYSASLKFGELPKQLSLSVSILALLVVGTGIWYSAHPKTSQAKIYRGTVTFFLLAYHIAVLAGFWK